MLPQLLFLLRYLTKVSYLLINEFAIVLDAKHKIR